ncbi:tyrosine-type recombinase/integrase [Desulfosporosinus sp. SYSU MS00001]|uniref:tyrosine-type recombinase/integrase n=1 Tax=Desulfosporosinus sp. SYSU MS00001 TaxID=3416284 RepID=UPI003CF1F969
MEVLEFAQHANKRERIGLSWDLSVEAFLNEKRAENLTEQSLVYYQQALSYLHSFALMIKVDAPEHFRKEHLNQWIRYMLEVRKNKATTVNSKIRAVRPFFTYLSESSYISHQMKIKLLKEDEPIIKTFSEEQIKKLIAKPDASTCTFAEFRDWVMICTFLATGMRLRSLIHLQVKDIDFVQKEILLTTTKNRKQQLIPLSYSLEPVLNAFLQVRKGEPTDFLFCNSYGEQLSKRNCEERVERYCSDRGINTDEIRCSPHTFRHTFAVQSLVNKTLNIFELQKVLSHSTLDMVKRYAKISDTDLKKNFKSPLDTFSSMAKNKGRKAISMKM